MKSQVHRNSICEAKSRQVTEPASSKSVFVGGIPSHLTAEDIQEIFTQYGRVISVKMAFKKGQTQMNNGYCVLTMSTAREATSIMQIRKIPIGQDRFAICKPFMTGNNLESFRQRHNRLKVIIKGIPQQLDEERLRAFFQAEVGALEEVFIFQSDKPLLRTPKHKLVQSARVTFTSPQQVKHFFEAGVYETEVMIDGFYVKLEMFRPDYKLPKKKLQKSETAANGAQNYPSTMFDHPSARNTLSLPSGELEVLENYWSYQNECQNGRPIHNVRQESVQLSNDESNLRFNVSKGSSLPIYRRFEFGQIDLLRRSHEEKYASKQTMASQ